MVRIQPRQFARISTAAWLTLGMMPAPGARATEGLLLDSPTVVNHYPGPDGLVGTADDVVSTGRASNQWQSAPNTPGAYSYYIVDFPTGSSPAPEFGEDVIRFVTGTAIIEPGTPSGTTVAFVITGGAFTGTEAYQGGGPAAGDVTPVGGMPNGGTVDLVSGEATINFDITVRDQFGGVFQYTDRAVSTTGYLVPHTQFGQTSNAYINDVLSPAAIARGARALIYAPFSFVLPPDLTNPGLSNAPISGVMVAYTTETMVLTPDQVPSVLLGNVSETPDFDANGDDRIDVADLAHVFLNTPAMGRKRSPAGRRAAGYLWLMIAGGEPLRK